MSNFFQVDLETLRRFVTSLEESGEHMESALNSLKSVESGQIGTSDLDDAADHFQQEWRYGLEELEKKIKATNDGLKAAYGTYQETEQSVVDSLEQVTQPGSEGK